VETTVDAARDLATAAGFELRLVDAGGGLGIPYESHEDGLDLRSLGTRLSALAARLAADPVTAGTRLLLEPGRFLVGAAGAYVARVVDRKGVGGHHVVILDGGIHHVLRPALVGQEHRVRVLTGIAASPGAANAQRFPVTVAGPLCSGLDVFAQAAVMTLPEPGDLVAVLDVGAYGATESMPFFLSHPLPPEIALSGGEAWVARPRIEPETWLGWRAASRPAVTAPARRRAPARISSRRPFASIARRSTSRSRQPHSFAWTQVGGVPQSASDRVAVREGGALARWFVLRLRRPDFTGARTPVATVGQSAGRLALVGLVAALLAAAVWAATTQTETGQRLSDLVLFGRETAGPRGADVAADILSTVTLAAAVTAAIGIAAIALARGGPGLLLAAVVAVAGANLTSQLLKEVVERPALLGSLAYARGNSFPSGTVTVVASLGLVAILVVPRRLRGVTGLLTAAAVSAVGMSTVVAGWHRLADVLGAILIALAWAALCGAMLAMARGWMPRRSWRTGLGRGSTVLGAVAGIAASSPAASSWSRSPRTRRR
jgi:membrane-associated phospholipid phosphatase